MKVICPYCQRPAKFVSGAVIYPHRPELVRHRFWSCAPCGAWVGCHRRSPRHGFNGDEPKGRLANSALRKLKQDAHAVFDPLWRSGEMTRTEAYTWLADALGIAPQNCHIGMFDVDGCEAVIAAVRRYRDAALSTT